MVFGVLPLAMMAQDDDLYFVPKKKSAEKVVDNYGMPRDTYYSGSDRSIDDYNRRLQSSYQVIDGDSTNNDIINFSMEQGVYPDSLSEDYMLTKQMTRFDDYELSNNAAFWAGYTLGRDEWGWHSPWYYSRYGWYGGWYDPWYYGYAGYYGWYDPWYYGWGYPYYWGGYYYHGGGGHRYAHIGTGTLRRDGSTHGAFHGGAVAGSSSRRSSLRERASAMGGSRTTAGSGNNTRSRSGNFSGYRGNSSTNRGSYSSSRSSSGSFGGSRSSGGGFSSGSSGGGSRSGGGGGGSRLGGRR